MRLLLLLLPGVAALSTFTKTAWNKKLRSLTKENFESIYEWEAWLEAEAGSSTYAKAMRRLGHMSKSFGIPLREGFMADAKATAKRREQQAAYVAAQEEARLAKIAEAEDGLRGAADSDDIEAIDAALAAATEANVPEDSDAWAPAREAKVKCEAAAEPPEQEESEEGA